MIQTRYVFPLLAIAGLAANSNNASATGPLVYINQGLTNECVVTPTAGTVFTLSATGDVLITGSYTGNGCSGTAATGAPSFSPLNPAPANLTIPNGQLQSTGGTVTPNFVVYYANSCAGKVTASTGCTAITGPWGTGGTVCTGTSSTYCSPGAATVSIPANQSTTAACTYTFQAINCSNGSGSVNSQTANVTVAAAGGSGGSCTPAGGGDLDGLGYTRQCAGTIASTNPSLHPSWDNFYGDGTAGLMSGPWPGNAGQLGYGLKVTVNANQYGSFAFNTGATAHGVHFESNGSYGTLGVISVSTVPGDFYGGTALCVGSTLNISSKTGTVATCKLALNTDYYLNFSSADVAPPAHETDCTAAACTTGWTTYGYSN